MSGTEGNPGCQQSPDMGGKQNFPDSDATNILSLIWKEDLLHTADTELASLLARYNRTSSSPSKV